MMFCKLLKYDLRQGIGRNWWKYLMLAGCILVFCYWGAKDFATAGALEYSGTDLVLALSGGMKEYIPSPDEKFEIPVVWICVQILFLIFDLNYCAGDLETVGSGRIVKSLNRGAWWLSKCCWMFLEVLSFWAVVCLGIMSYCLAAGRPFFSAPSGAILTEVLKLDGSQLTEGQNWIWCWILPLIFIVTLGVVQMFVSLLWNSVGAFVGTMILLIVTLYWNNGIIMLNHVMALRSYVIVKEGYAPGVGSAVCTAMVSAIVVLGLLYIKRRDILPREE